MQQRIDIRLGTRWNLNTNTPIICNVIYLQIIGWHLNFECYFSSENEKDNSRNLCGGMMAVGEELRDGSRAFRPRRRHVTNRRRVQ